MLNAKLERHLARPHALLHEISAFIYIYIYWLIGYAARSDVITVKCKRSFSFITSKTKLLNLYVKRSRKIV